MVSESPSSQWRGWIQLLLGLGLTFLFFYMMAPFVVALLIGSVLAILCYPTFEKLKEKLPPSISALLMTIAISVGVLAPMVFTLYTAVYKSITLLNRFKIIKEGQNLEHLSEHPVIQRGLGFLTRFVPIDKEWLQEQALNFLGTLIENISSIVASFLSSMPGLILAFAIVILSTYFFLLDGGRFLKFLVSLSPLNLERSKDLYSTFEKSCRGVVVGLFLSALAQGFLMSILFLLTGLPDPLIIGFFTIIFGMIPLVGSSPIWIIATFYLGSQSSWGLMVLMLVGGIFISTIDNVIRPIVMKEHAEMHPLLALVSVFGAVRLIGPTGIFLGPVIAAVFVSFLKILSLELRRENISSTRQ